MLSPLTCRCGIRAVQEASPKAKIVIYSADGLSGDELRRNAQEKFSITVPNPVEVRERCLIHVHYPLRAHHGH